MVPRSGCSRISAAGSAGDQRASRPRRRVPTRLRQRALGALGDEQRHPDHDRELGELRRLDRHAAEHQPRPRAVDRRAHHQHQHQPDRPRRGRPAARGSAPSGGRWPSPAPSARAPMATLTSCFLRYAVGSPPVRSSRGAVADQTSRRAEHDEGERRRASGSSRARRRAGDATRCDGVARGRCRRVSLRAAGSSRRRRTSAGPGRRRRRGSRPCVGVHLLAVDAVEASQILRTAGPEVPEPVPAWLTIITTT